VKESRIILVLSLIVIAIAVAVWLDAEPDLPEPRYAGKPLHQWLTAYDPQIRLSITMGDLAETDNALRQIGTNAVPVLLRLQQAHDSYLKLKFFAFLKAQHIYPVHHIPAYNLNYAATRGFMALGTNGQSAVPQLIAIYRADYSMSSRELATRSLEAIGPAAQSAVPALVASFTGAGEELRLRLLETLGAIHSDPDKSVPAIASALNDRNWIVRHYAALELMHFGPAATSAVPALLKTLADTNAIVRQYATNALLKIDPAALARTAAK
jgi:hypothetical protein